MDDLENRTGRDTRLLALVIVIALVVLFVLARFRFQPTAAIVTPIAQGPLDRLAATSTYEDLAAAVRTSLQQANAAVVLVNVESVPAEQKPPAKPDDQPEVIRYQRLVGVRLKGGAVLLDVPAGFRVTAAAGGAPLTVRNVDPRRGITVMAGPEGDGSSSPLRQATDFNGFAYVSVVEAASGGPSARPVFIGRVDWIPDPRWGGDVLAAGGRPDLPPGSLVFLLDGRFVGLVIAMPDGVRALVPASLLEAALDVGAAGMER